MCGIIFIVFGKEYEKLAIKTIAYSRKFTKLPFIILTNVKNLEKEWDNIENISFKYFENIHNRQIKTTLIDHSPFDLTLYMDVDSIITKQGVDDALNLLQEYDLLLVKHSVYTKTSRMMQAYKNTFSIHKIQFPISIYHGALICFNKTDNAYMFFKEWNRCWKESKEKRDMPALACAVQKLNNINLKILSIPDLFGWHENNPTGIIQHEYRDSWWSKHYPEVGVNRIRIEPEPLK